MRARPLESVYAIRSLLGRENDALNDDNDTHQPPDTGFKLIPLIRSVLDASEATETDDLAMEVLGRIPQYDRETALYQALRQLVRQSFRPAFIPQSPKDATVGEVPRQRRADDPPPERDGRQWMPSFVPPADEGAGRLSDDEADAALDLVEHEVAVAIDAGEDEQQVRKAAGVVADGIAQRRLPPQAPGLSALAQQPRKYEQRDTATRPLSRPGNRRPTYSLPQPKTSPRVAAIREAWRKSLLQRIAVGEGQHKFLGDCTALDLTFAAEQREQHAKRTLDRAHDLRRLIALMREHDASKLSDLPAEVLAEAPLDGAA